MEKAISEISRKCGLHISEFITETESKEYGACQFKVSGQKVIGRIAKTTPKKVGQFVTFWKRNNKGITQPFSEKDNFHFYVVNVTNESRTGQFVFSKSVLIAKGIVSTEKRDGKRGFRVYPIWDTHTNKQAEKTQQWQLLYFYEINGEIDLQKVAKLYGYPSN